MTANKTNTQNHNNARCRRLVKPTKESSFKLIFVYMYEAGFFCKLVFISLSVSRQRSANGCGITWMKSSHIFKMRVAMTLTICKTISNHFYSEAVYRCCVHTRISAHATAFCKAFAAHTNASSVCKYAIY